MTTQTSCLDHETLAAFIDGRLREDSRRSVVDHLAQCEDCYELMVESLRLHQTPEGEEDQDDRPLLALVPDPEDPE